MPDEVRNPPLRRLDAAEHHHGGLRDVLRGSQTSRRLQRRLDRLAQLVERRGAGGRWRIARRNTRDRLDDRVVPAEHCARVCGFESEQLRDHARGQRTGELPAKLRTTVRFEAIDQRAYLGLDERSEPFSHLSEAERRREWI